MRTHRHQVARLALAVILLVSALINILSPINIKFALPAGIAVVLGTIPGLLFGAKRSFAHMQWKGLFHFKLRPLRISHRILYIAFYMALLAQIAFATTQALAIVDLPSPLLGLNNTPGIGVFYLTTAAGVAFIAAWLVFKRGEAGFSWAALLAAGLFGSTLYLRTFAVPEAGPVYGAVFAMALVAASFTSPANISSRYSFLRIPLTAWSAAFVGILTAAVLVSPALGESMPYGLRLAILVSLSLLIAWRIKSLKAWQISAWIIVAIAGAAPILLAMGKLAEMAVYFGLPAALAYRLHPNEMGGANLVSRSVLIVVPLGLALLSTLPASPSPSAGPGKSFRLRKAASITAIIFLLAGSAFVMVYSRAWGGFFAWLLALCIYVLLAYGNDIRSSRRWPRTRIVKWSLAGTLSLAVLIIGFGLVQLAPHLNIYSYNGRLIHWYGAVLALMDHPWLGGGPGFEAIYTPYAEAIRLFAGTQTTIDAPLSVLSIDAGSSLKLHSHNLFLEFAAGSGIFSLLAFGGYLAALFYGGMRVLRSSGGALRLGVAACMAGIAGELAWSMLDVLWVTPPFFSFPIWGLVGLLLAAGAIPDGRRGEIPVPPNGKSVLNWQPNYHLLLVIAALPVVFLPAVSSSYYRSGFLAFQEQRWRNAADYYEEATHYAPLKTDLHAQLAKAYLELGEYDRAADAYERASSLKRGFSPYYTQMGWLAWLQGDVDRARDHFIQAVNIDPGETWSGGLHANLGLVMAAQGQHLEAATMFKKSIEMNPRLASASFWQALPRSSLKPGTEVNTLEMDIVLDPIYMQGPSIELSKRILSHLGVSDLTRRSFEVPQSLESPIALIDILREINSDHMISDGYRTSLSLAALAEASRLAGLVDLAEQAYIDYQVIQPKSAHGFRDLGMLYHTQGRLREAQSLLEKAVEVSPGDISSRYNLALVYLDQRQWAKAEQELDAIIDQSLVTLFRSRLFDPNIYSTRARLLIAQGDLEEAAVEFRKAIYILGLPADYLALADLYLELEKPELAEKQCTRAAEILIQNWSRSLSPDLRDAGVCLAHMETLPETVLSLSHSQPLLGNVLSGHTYRARGELVQALGAYQAASEARPDEGGPHFLLGETYQALGHPDLAETEYRLAADLDPQESLPLLALGRMQWSMGSREEALLSFQAAVEVTPGWGEAHTALANALLALEDIDEANKHFHLAKLVDEVIVEGELFDFITSLADAEIRAPGSDYIRGDYFTINGMQRRVLFMHPESSAGYSVTLPDEPGVGLSFDLGTAPDSWTQPGDGVAFTVSVSSENETRQIFSKYIDPKNNPSDRRWHSETIDLTPYRGKTITLAFETNAGPEGDNRYDWAGWGEARLLHPAKNSILQAQEEILHAP